MSKVTQCDRCAIVYDESKNMKEVHGVSINQMILRNDKSDEKIVFDLCPKCMNTLNWWLLRQNPEQENKKKSVMTSIIDC